jgi:hypothetical protein
MIQSQFHPYSLFPEDQISSYPPAWLCRVTGSLVPSEGGGLQRVLCAWYQVKRSFISQNLYTQNEIKWVLQAEICFTVASNSCS